MTKLINMFAGPGAGKSTMAAGLFYRMKTEGFNVELAPEYAKDLVYEGRMSTMKNQLYILGKQHNRIERLKDHVDYIITDSPLLLSYYYGLGQYPDSFYDLVVDIHDSFDNVNYFVSRLKPYSEIGRVQTMEEAKIVDQGIKHMLLENNIKYKEVPGNEEGLNKVVAELYF